MTLDIDFVRSHFPAFSDPAQQHTAFFESAGGSFACSFVIDRLTRFYRERKVQPYWTFEASRLGGEEMDEARTRLAGMLGVHEHEVNFGPSTTQNVYVLANAFREYLKPGDAIVVTNQDHEANSGAWRRLETAGIEVREWELDPATGHLDLERLQPLLKGAKLLCFPHCSNVIGEINDVAAISALAHAEGAFVCVDGVSYAPHGLPNVTALGPDVYLFSAYKTYGPHQGIMVIREGLAQALPNQGHFFNAGDLNAKFTPAGPDHAQIAACAGMADYSDALYASLSRAELGPVERTEVVHDAMRAREVELLEPLLDYVASKNSLKLVGTGDAEKRAPTVSLLGEQRGEDMADALAQHGIGAGGGDFYGIRPVQAMGVDPAHGVLRVSFTHYTTEEEIDRLIRAIDLIV